MARPVPHLFRLLFATGWLLTPIGLRAAVDFVARLAAEGLGPQPAASRETLIRRVSLDLTGLPPSLQEVDAFLADNSPDAYENVVDRLLASPRYGEHMAAPWLRRGCAVAGPCALCG